MSATNAAAAAILSLYFENATHANIGDATGLVGSTADGVYYISLHTADPGGVGNQSTSEATYTSYARVSVARDAGNWTVVVADPATAKNDAAISFPQATGGSDIVTYFGVGTNLSGIGNLLFTGALTSSLAISNGITPDFAVSALVVTVT